MFLECDYWFEEGLIFLVINFFTQNLMAPTYTGTAREKGKGKPIKRLMGKPDIQ